MNIQHQWNVEQVINKWIRDDRTNYNEIVSWSTQYHLLVIYICIQYCMHASSSLVPNENHEVTLISIYYNLSSIHGSVWDLQSKGYQSQPFWFMYQPWITWRLKEWASTVSPGRVDTHPVLDIHEYQHIIINSQ